MKKAGLGNVVIAICISVTVLLTPSVGSSFDSVEWGDGNAFTMYGFMRNNLGMFMDAVPYAENGNQFATARTWLRTYGDLSLGDYFSARIATQFIWEPWYKNEQGSPSVHGGKEYSEYDNINDVLREAFIEWKPNINNNFKVGRQIVIWGESLTEQVGDVIHPNDARSGFVVGNQEDARIPQWMIRGMHFINPLNSSFEWIVNPLLTQDEYSVSRGGSFAIITVPGQEPADGDRPQRFAFHTEDRANPLPKPFMVNTDYPDSFSDLRYGFRTSTTLPNMQLGMTYWHTQVYSPLYKWGTTVMTIPGVVTLRNMTLVYPDYDIFGLYMNKQLYPLPGVLRIEAVYSPNRSFGKLDVRTVGTGIEKRDWVKYVIGYDLPGYFYFDWHNTAAFDITLEHIGEWVPDSDNIQYGIWDTRQPTYHGSIATRISTNFFYNRIATGLIASYDTFGKSGLVIPNITYNPGWYDSAFSFDLKYYRIYGESHYKGLGIFKSNDMIILTTQFNF